MVHVTCIWLDGHVEEAAAFYVSVFPGGRINGTSRYPDDNPAGLPAGSILTMDLELAGHRYTLLNGGPGFPHNGAVSVQIMCKDQAEVDHYWDALGDGGKPGPCGWVTDKFGVPWQVVPAAFVELIASDDRAAADRVFQAMLPMTKLDLAVMQAAYEAS